ncbi:hypothetical protein ABID12_001806 [Martelella mangrovi]|uniref:Integrase n=1 Tax=Martelella mangrovi TaxID=1397477 RepID=A0ABV2IAS6_9HYPH
MLNGLAELLVELGVSQYRLMAILEHSEAKTSKAYTHRADRWKLSNDAMQRLNVPHT